jgi:hypothetical protein
MPVRYRLVGRRDIEAYPRVCAGRLVDISISGAQVRGPVDQDVERRELLAGSVLVRLEMRATASSAPFSIDAEVSWLKPVGPAGEDAASLAPEDCSAYSAMGLRFVGVSQDQRKQLQGLLITVQMQAGGLRRGG